MKTWSIKGKPATFNSNPKSKNISFLAAIDEQGIVRWKIIEGGVNAQDLFIFLLELLERNDFFMEMNQLFFLIMLEHHSIKFILEPSKQYFNFIYNTPLYSLT